MGELAVPSYTPVVNSLDDLASDRFIKPVTIKSTAVDDMMLVCLIIFVKSLICLA